MCIICPHRILDMDMNVLTETMWWLLCSASLQRAARALSRTPNYFETPCLCHRSRCCRRHHRCSAFYRIICALSLSGSRPALSASRIVCLWVVFLICSSFDSLLMASHPNIRILSECKRTLERSPCTCLVVLVVVCSGIASAWYAYGVCECHAIVRWS